MPTDIGEVGLATRSMLTKRLGLPRSCTSAAKLAVIATSAPMSSGAPQRRATGEIGAGREHRRARSQPTEEQVCRDVLLPRRRLDHRPSVVRRERRIRDDRSSVGRFRDAAGPSLAQDGASFRRTWRRRPPPGRQPPRPRWSTSASCRASGRPDRAAARRSRARPAARTSRRCRRPRRWGPRRTGCASATPCSCSVSTRAAARARSSSRSPYWIDSVGHACAHAGMCPASSRS